MTQADFRYLVEDRSSHDGTIYTDVFKTEEEAQKQAACLIYLQGIKRLSSWVNVAILYVEKTEDYYLSEDLADENFSWGAYHSADEIELKRLGHHYV